MKTQSLGITLTAIALLAPFPAGVHAITWSGGTGGTGTSWNDPANWSGGMIPGPAADAYFNVNAGLTAGKVLSLDTPQSVGQIQFYGTTVDCSIGSAGDLISGNTLALVSVVRSGYPGGTQTIAANTVLASDSLWSITGGGVGVTVTGSLSGPGRSLTKTGAGMLTLSGNNSYSGDTAVNDGMLTLGHANALGSSGTIGFGGGTLRLFNTTDLSGRFSQTPGQLYYVDTAGQNVTFATPLTSAGGRLSKSGSGTLTLGVANSYSGTTTVSAGTLTFSGAGSLGSTTADLVMSGGTLDLATASPLTVGTLYITGGATVQNGTLTATDYDFYATGAPSISAVLTGSDVDLTKGGSAVLTLANANSYTGTTTVNGGTLTLNFNAATAPTSDIVHGTSALRLGGGTLTLTGKNSTSLSQTFNGLTLNTGASAFTLSTGNSAGSALLTLGTIACNVGATVNFSQPTGNTTPSASNGYVTSTGNDATGILGAYATVANADWAANNGVNIVAFTGYTTLSGANPPIVDGATSNVRVSNGSSGDVGQAAGTVTVNTLLVNDAAARKVTLASGNTLRLGSLGGILKTGAGALTLGSAGDAGTLTAGGADNTAGELVFQNATTVTNHATLANNGAGAVAVTKAGAGTLALMATSTFTGGLTVNAGTLQLPGGSNPLSTSGSITVNGGTLNLGAAAQTTSGTVSMRGGTLSNGILTMNGAALAAEAGTISAKLDGTAGLYKTTAGTLTLANTVANTFTGTTTIVRGSVVGGSAADVVSINGPLVVGSPDGGPSASYSNSGNNKAFSSSKTLTVYKNGTVNFGGGSQNLNATINILGGYVVGTQIYGNGAIVMTGGTFAGLTYANARTFTINDSPSTARVTASSNMPYTFVVANGDAVVDVLFAGALSGANTLTKSGLGLMEATGMSSHSSGTTISVNGGTLLVNNKYASGTGSGPVTVNAGATLGGAGFIGGVVNHTNANVSVIGASGNLATLWPGSKDAVTGDHVFGTLTVGSVAQTNNVTMGNYSKLKINIGTAGAQDRLTVNGVLNLASAGNSDTLELSVDSDARPGAYVLASATGGITGQFNGSVVGKPSNAQLFYSGTTVELMVPFPPTLVLIR